ncbi:MAG: cob(I)yrinic acid a,c-diamide adenosyltransferase [Candidatus Micrarchaeaceae archaeon]
MSDFYTGTGDEGKTGILDNKRLLKSDYIIEAIGNVDELNSYLGVVYEKANNEEIKKIIFKIQNDLFVIGANLASLSNGKIEKATLQEEKLKFIEESIEFFSQEIPPLKQFVIPGGCESATTLHVARSISRRMERSIVRAGTEYKLDKSLTSYANRISSLFFTMALYINIKNKVEEKHPTY